MGIHNGEVTHHHDQSILCVNFNVMNIKKSIVGTPIPPDVLFVMPINLLYALS